MISVRANRDTCSGFATCVAVSPDIFDLDDEGLVVLAVEQVADDRLETVRQAAYDCPTESISFVQDTTRAP